MNTKTLIATLLTLTTTPGVALAEQAKPSPHCTTNTEAGRIIMDLPVREICKKAWETAQKPEFEGRSLPVTEGLSDEEGIAGQLVNGLPEGVWRLRQKYKNTIRFAEVNFRNGRPHGHWSANQNGATIDGEYRNGIEDGTWTVIEKEETVLMTLELGRLISAEHFKQGKLLDVIRRLSGDTFEDTEYTPSGEVTKHETVTRSFLPEKNAP